MLIFIAGFIIGVIAIGAISESETPHHRGCQVKPNYICLIPPPRKR